jgi:hypothetical protein
MCLPAYSPVVPRLPPKAGGRDPPLASLPLLAAPGPARSASAPTSPTICTTSYVGGTTIGALGSHRPGVWPFPVIRVALTQDCPLRREVLAFLASKRRRHSDVGTSHGYLKQRLLQYQQLLTEQHNNNARRSPVHPFGSRRLPHYSLICGTSTPKPKSAVETPTNVLAV